MGIACQLVLDLFKQGVDGNGGQHFHRLFDGGQLNAGQAAVADIVEAQQGEILGNSQPHFLRRLHDAQGVGVGGGEHGGEFPLLNQKLLGQLIAIFNGGAGEGVVAELGGKSQVLTGGGVAFAAELVGDTALPLAEIENIPVPQPVQVLHTHIGPPEIIHGDIALLGIPEVFSHKHCGKPGEEGLQAVVALGPRGQENHTVHLAADHQLKQLPLLLNVPGGVAEDNIVASGPGLTVNVIGKLGHKGIIDARKNEPQKLGAFHDHGPGHGVGGVVHFFADIQDSSSGFLADFRAAGQSPGHGGIGDAGGFCHILDGNVFHTVTSLRKCALYFRNSIVKAFAKKSKGKLYSFLKKLFISRRLL